MAEVDLDVIERQTAPFETPCARAVLDLVAEAKKLRAFKKYVHGRLDAANVPADPEPTENAKTGCRIEGRLNHVLAARPMAAKLREAFLRVADALIEDGNLHEEDDAGEVCKGSSDGCDCELPNLINETLNATVEAKGWQPR